MSNTRDITLQWKDPNIIEKGYKVYRSKEPMDINNMPEAIADLEKNSTEFIDKDQEMGRFYYYRVSAWIDSHEEYSNEFKVFNGIAKPTINTTEDITEFPSGGVFTASEYIGNGEHVSTDWEVRDLVSDELLWSSYGDINYMDSLSFFISPDSSQRDLKIRVRYNGEFAISEWSEMFSFTTGAYIPMFIFSGSSDNTVRKIDPDGNQLWKFEGHTNRVLSVVVSPDGYIYSGGSDNRVRKIDLEGNQVWEYSFSTIRDIFVGFADNNVYVAGGTKLEKISHSGNKLWEFNDPNGRNIYSVAVDNDNNVYCGSENGRIHKVSSIGMLIWSESNQSRNVSSITVDGFGYVYSGTSGLNADRTVAKIDSNGNKVWKFEHPTGISDIKVDANGYVYSSAGSIIRKIDQFGREVWGFDGHRSTINGITVDVNGYVYSASRDDTVRKIDPYGNEVWIYEEHDDNVNGVAVDPIPVILSPKNVITEYSTIPKMIKLTWKNRNTLIHEDGFRIYKSHTKIDINDLPDPLAEVDTGITSFYDTDVIENEVYHYVISSYRGDKEVYSKNHVAYANPFNFGIGSFELIGGDMENEGFFGEVSAEDFFTARELYNDVGIPRGSIAVEFPTWLKFIIDGKIIYVAKNPLVTSISWDNINSVNAVYNDENAPIVEKDGYQFRVTLMRGANSDPMTGTGNERHNNSEWDRLMYRIHENDPSGDPWVSYTDQDLSITRWSWVQESLEDDPSRKVYRGRYGITGINSSSSSSYGNSAYAWRPVLRLIH